LNLRAADPFATLLPDCLPLVDLEPQRGPVPAQRLLLPDTLAGGHKWCRGKLSQALLHPA
jgi:hypothetical protein